MTETPSKSPKDDSPKDGDVQLTDRKLLEEKSTERSNKEIKLPAKKFAEDKLTASRKKSMLGSKSAFEDEEVEVGEEDASDLLYDKELKLLLEDHKAVTRFIMIFAIFGMIG